MSFVHFRKTSGVTHLWLFDRFNDLDTNAPAWEVERYARVWLWHFLASFLFPDSSGNTISWIFVDIMTKPWEEIAAYSWGSAVLAWTYRKLCDAYHRTSTSASLGGCAYLLQI
jgi:hypothetical protein